jgi:hypothetical protein
MADPNRNRPGDKRRADANTARAKAQTNREIGTVRGETTGGSRSNNRGGMSPVGSSQPPSMGLGQSAINNASFIDYRRTPGATARETLDLGRFAGPSFYERQTTYHQRLGEIDRKNVRAAYADDLNNTVNGHAFGKRPPVVKGTQNTTSPLSARDTRSAAELRKLASDTRAGHKAERGRNSAHDELTDQNVRNANATARMHENAAKSTGNAHANAYYGRQTDRMREMTGNKRQPGNFEDVAPSDSHRGGDKYGPATKESVARDLGEYATRPLGKEFVDAGTKRQPGQHVSEAPPKSIGKQFRMNAPGIARSVVAGLGAGALTVAHDARRSGSEGNTSPRQDASDNRRSNSSDMGPVKGRALTLSNRHSGGEPKQSGKGHSTGTKVVR